jgi:RND family efflux transporter MFP subunit
VVITCSLFFFSGCGKNKTPSPSDKIHPVSVSKIIGEDIPETLEFKGSFIPSDKLDVPSEVDGKITSVSVGEGQTVAPGDALAVLNPDVLTLQLDKSQKELKELEAKIEAGLPIKPPVNPTREAGVPENPSTANEERDTNNEERPEVPTDAQPPSDDTGSEAPPPRPNPNFRVVKTTRPIGAENSGAPPESPGTSEADLQDKLEAVHRAEEATADRLRADIALLEKKIESANMGAGIGGVISKKNVTEGSVVKVGEILFQIVKSDPIILSVFVPKEQINSFKKEDKASIICEELKGQSLVGEVSFIAPEPDPQNKNYEVKIAVINPQAKIKSGMSGRVTLPLQQIHRGFLIPPSAIVTKDKKNYVYVAKGQIAQRREVEMGGVIRDRVEIKKGLSEGELIVVQGQERLSGAQEYVKVQ